MSKETLEFHLSLSAIQAQMSFLQGKVLTIIDASFASETQNKAIKDLVKKEFRDQMRWMDKLASGSVDENDSSTKN